MALTEITLDHVRNIRHARLNCDPRLNIIYGANASGKTSLLEAIHILASARSFRTARINQVISRDQACLTVQGSTQQSQQQDQLGLERCRQQTRIRINRENIKQSSALAGYLPLQVVTPESHDILQQGPKFRRQLLDWGMFHVKQGYLECVKAFMRVLRQRNAALRNEKHQELARSFDTPLINSAQRLSQQRQAYVDAISPKIIAMTQALSEQNISVHYQSGWKVGQDYADVLMSQFESDCVRHHTQSGPHRADLVFKVDGVPVQQALSRGQQKMLVCSLRLAQLQYYSEQTGQRAVVLVDDLAAELDKQHRQRLLGLLMDSQAQVFITLTEKDLLDTRQIASKTVFHVEQGEIHQETP